MTNCTYCGKEITSLPFKGRNKKLYCVAHKIPESRGEKGIPVYGKGFV